MKKRGISGLRLLLAFLVITGLCLLWINHTGGSNDYTLYVDDELLIQPKAGVSKAKLRDILSGHNAIIIEEIPSIKVKRINVPAHALENVKSALSKNPKIEFVEYNFLAEPSIIPDDYYYLFQEGRFSLISASAGWDISTGSSNLPIAIIDTGIDLTHPDLSAKILPGYNFYDGNTDVYDNCHHGTLVAGVAAAITNNSIGVAGVAWDNPIMPLKVSNPIDCRATTSNLAKAIIYAVDKSVKIINISFGGPGYSSTLQNAVDYAWNKGSLIFASAGNDAKNEPNYPAACKNVIAVSATDGSDLPANYTNYGDWIDISAPGTGYTTLRGGGYGLAVGTSISSPYSAGLGALVFSANPSLSNAQVEDIIKKNADDLGEPGFDIYYGWGRINVYKSLLAATGVTPEPDIISPSVTITSPSDGSSISGGITVSVSATDNIGIIEVELYNNRTLYAVDDTEPYNFYWDTTNYPDGVYELVAFAYDPSGNVGESNYVTVYVSNPKDTIAPSVSITSPVDGSKVSGKQKINITASDNTGVSRIDLYIDGVLRRSVTNRNSLTYTWNTNKETPGSHIIEARAYDEANNEGMSRVVVYK